MRSPLPASGWSPSRMLPWDPMAPGAVGAGAMMRTGGERADTLSQGMELPSTCCPRASSPPHSGVSLPPHTVGTWCGWASPASTNAPLSQFGFTRSWWGEGVGGVGRVAPGWVSCVSTCLPLGIIHLHPLIPPCTLLPSPATPLAPCYPPYSAQSSTGWGCSMAFPGPPKPCCEPADPGPAQPCWVWEGGWQQVECGGVHRSREPAVWEGTRTQAGLAPAQGSVLG